MNYFFCIETFLFLCDKNNFVWCIIYIPFPNIMMKFYSHSPQLHTRMIPDQLFACLVKMAAPVLLDPTSPPAPGFVPGERDLARSEEEEKLLKKIREEKERLWCEIQVGRRHLDAKLNVCMRFLYFSPFFSLSRSLYVVLNLL